MTCWEAFMIIMLLRHVNVVWRTHRFWAAVSGHYLDMIGPQHNPSAETISHVNGSCTAAEANHIGKCSSESHNQDLRAIRGSEQWATCILCVDWRAEEVNKNFLGVRASHTYVVLLKKAEVANDSDPHQQSGRSQQDSTGIVRWQGLQKQTTMAKLIIRYREVWKKIE